jgi:hypothetical protein
MLQLEFAGTRVAIEHHGLQAAHLLQLLFAHVRCPQPDPALAASLSLISAELGQPLVFSRAGRVLHRSVDPGDMAEQVLATVSYDLVDGCKRAPVIHAAAVRPPGSTRGLLLPAQSGSGKSTLCAWLVSRGCSHMSDELVELRADDGQMLGFRRPIELKQGSLPIIAPLRIHPLSRDTWLETPTGGMLAPELLSTEPATPHCELGAIVFPHYVAGVSRELRRLSQAEASARLLQCCLNARHLPAHGLPACADWARRVPAYAAQYGELAGLDSALLELGLAG